MISWESMSLAGQENRTHLHLHLAFFLLLNVRSLPASRSPKIPIFSEKMYSRVERVSDFFKTLPVGLYPYQACRHCRHPPRFRSLQLHQLPLFHSLLLSSNASVLMSPTTKLSIDDKPNGIFASRWVSKSALTRNHGSPAKCPRQSMAALTQMFRSVCACFSIRPIF